MCFIFELELKMEYFDIESVFNYGQAINDGNQHKRQLIFGPGKMHLGPRPPISCELYVTNLPSNLDCTRFFQWLNRVGSVYEMRIMMNSPCETRGYCFVRYFQESCAVAAYEMMSFVFLNSKRPNAQGSQCKRQLFVGGIPKSLALWDVRDNFQKRFPLMTRCVVYSPTEIVAGHKNRGFAFLEFSEHDAALKAKKFLRNNTVWGQYIKVDWARARSTEESCTLFTELLSNLKKNDYCAKLRLYAIANNWCVPIIVYGSNYKQHGVQYGGVLLKDPLSANYSCIIVEVVDLTRVFDVHVLLCEVATHLIEVVCGLPQKHYVVRVRSGDTAKIMLSFIDINELISLSIRSNKFVSGISVIQLMTSLNILAQYQSEAILSVYKLSFQSQIAVNQHIAMFRLIKDRDLSHFCSIYPKFRDNYPLNNKFNDTEIILLQANANCYIDSCMSPDEFEQFLNTRTSDEGAFLLKSQRYNRHPNYVLKYVDFDLLRKFTFYHPVQRVNSPPLWVRGETYQKTIFENY